MNVMPRQVVVVGKHALGLRDSRASYDAGNLRPAPGVVALGQAERRRDQHRAADGQALCVRLNAGDVQFYHRAPIILPVNLADAMLRRGSQATGQRDNLLPVAELVLQVICGNLVEMKRLVGQAKA